MRLCGALRPFGFRKVFADCVDTGFEPGEPELTMLHTEGTGDKFPLVSFVAGVSGTGEECVIVGVRGDEFEQFEGDFFDALLSREIKLTVAVKVVELDAVDRAFDVVEEVEIFDLLTLEGQNCLRSSRSVKNSRIYQVAQIDHVVCGEVAIGDLHQTLIVIVDVVVVNISQAQTLTDAIFAGCEIAEPVVSAGICFHILNDIAQQVGDGRPRSADPRLQSDDNAVDITLGCVGHDNVFIGRTIAVDILVLGTVQGRSLQNVHHVVFDFPVIGMTRRIECFTRVAWIAVDPDSHVGAARSCDIVVCILHHVSAHSRWNGDGKVCRAGGGNGDTGSELFVGIIEITVLVPVDPAGNVTWSIGGDALNIQRDSGGRGVHWVGNKQCGDRVGSAVVGVIAESIFVIHERWSIWGLDKVDRIVAVCVAGGLSVCFDIGRGGTEVGTVQCIAIRIGCGVTWTVFGERGAVLVGSIAVIKRYDVVMYPNLDRSVREETDAAVGDRISECPVERACAIDQAGTARTTRPAVGSVSTSLARLNCRLIRTCSDAVARWV